MTKSVPFWAAIAIFIAIGIVILNFMPQVGDIIALAGWTIVGALAGRKSKEWF